MTKEEINKLDERVSKLIDEEWEIQDELIDKILTLVSCSFDSDTLKTKIISESKSLHQLRHEIVNCFDQIDFLKKCEKEGYKK